jgi:thiol-disulfide isomerase/thioredoxin
MDEVEYKKEFDYKGELPFQFEVVYDSEQEFHINIINGEEKIKVKDIKYGIDRSTAKDTIIIDFPVYDTYIQGIYEDGVIEGNWHVNYKDNYAIPFIAFHGEAHRFSNFGKQAEVDLSGNWDVKFEAGTDDEYPAIGEFVQNGNQISGTFLTETGDYRFLDGIVYNNKAFLSCFDGSHAFLFEAKQLEDKSLVGSFRSGKHYTSNWIATKSEDAMLTNAFNLTKVENAKPDLDFSFVNTEGKQVSLKDAAYTDKVKLVMIMGTWCPNCRDEMNFLKEYFKANPNDQVEMIAIGFERYKSEEKCIEVLKKYKEKMEVDFEVLYGGYASKSLATEKFTMLDKIISWPTLLFVDKEDKIRKIHTGFNGPATSKFAGFKKEFEEIIKELSNE